jgi:hypothetical protein
VFEYVYANTQARRSSWEKQGWKGKERDRGEKRGGKTKCANKSKLSGR